MIAGLSFRSDNTLLVATNSNMLYYLSPTACPATYTNQNSVFICLDGQYSDQELKQCVGCSFACSQLVYLVSNTQEPSTFWWLASPLSLWL